MAVTTGAAVIVHRKQPMFGAGHRARPGMSLPVPSRRDLEAALHHDFAGVRVHADGQAASDTRRLGARAFTVGHDVFFAPGAYAPATREGRKLIAHELTHVVQQSGSIRAGTARLGATGSGAEREAAAVAERVSAGRPAGPIGSCAHLVQRQPEAGAPEPADLSAPLQSTWSPGSPEAFSIEVESSKAQPDDASGSASSRKVFPFSNQGRLEHFCSTPADYPLQIRFYVDSVATPRPQPFRPPALSVAAVFTPSGGASRRIADAADAAPRYPGPGWALAPAFGELFTASSSQSGALSVKATLRDPDTSTAVTYRDTVTCELVPCV